MHHSFAWCFFFYLSFLFPPVEPGVFNCCVTKIKHPHKKYGCLNLFPTCHFQQIVLSYDRDAEVGRFLQLASGFFTRDDIRSLFRD